MTQAADRQRNALQVIFSFFLGLMVTAFIGVGVNTFYPSPGARYDDQLDELYREQEQLGFKQDPSRQGGLTPAEEARMNVLQGEIRDLQKERDIAFQPWARNTSIILILFATMVMSISLIRMEQLRIISNGLLLGGVFTMLYGTGWVIASGQSWIRFAVMSFALAVTFALGYARFVQGREAPRAAVAAAGAGAAGVVTDAELLSIEARVAALERRTAAAASALGRARDED